MLRDAQRRGGETVAATSESTGAISLESVAVTFGTGQRETPAIGNVSGSVPAGAFVSIVGPSGCGKTTLLDVIAGLTRPSRGSVAVSGSPVTGPRADTAIVFQEDSTLHWRTTLDNIAFGLEVRGVARGERLRRAHEVAEALGLRGFEGHRPGELSGGMRQRVAIGRAFAMDPPILLMDEPFGALDQLTRRAVGGVLLDLWWAKDRGPRKTVVFITHDTSEAVLLSDEVWVLSPRPCEIVAKVPVDLERPRSKGMVTTAAFQGVVERIDNALKSRDGSR